MNKKLPYVKPKFDVSIVNLEYGIANASDPTLISDSDVEPYTQDWKLEKTFVKEIEFNANN